MKFNLTLITLLITFFSYAQKGSVKGTLTDKDMNNEPLPFANVQLKGTTIGTTTDENGKYSIDAEPGNYKIVFSFLGYESVEVSVTVKANQTTTINSSLTAGGGVALQDVVVATTRRKNTESALVMEMKEAKQVISAISAEQMSKGTDSNAAQAMQRVPGVTINDGKFVMVRGLNERYNNVMINGALAPSTEVDRRTFSFDLLPTSALEKMTVSKTGAAYLPGDFAGGLVSVTTSENFNDFTQLSFNVGFRNNTTFDDYFQTEGSPTDFLGTDNGFRQLPSGFPSDRDALNNNEQSVLAANQLSNNFNPTEGSAFLDTGIGFSLGRQIKLKNDRLLSTINMLSYSNKFQNFTKNVNTYINDLTSGNVTQQQLQRDFDDAYYSNEVRLSLLSNWSYRYNPNNKITFKNLYNQIGENFTTLRTGFDIDQRPGQLLNNYEFGYSGRKILTSQFNGEHKLSEKNNINWVLGGNIINDILPDLRRFRTFRDIDTPNAPFKMIDPPSSNPFDTGRFYSELNEQSVNGGVDYEHKIERVKNDEEFANIVLKAGVFTDYKTRDFSARYFSYLIPGNVSPDRKEELLILPLTEVFSPANVTATNGWVLREGSNQSDSYKANNLLTAGYVYGELPIAKLLLTGGVRIEHNRLEVDGFQGIQRLLVEQPITSVLPSVNFSYTFNEKNLLRLAYSRTVNRPEFREIAPFLFYDFQEDTEVVGSTDLTTATIDNFDLRYELYPSKGETASIGVFYKNFDKPIEFNLPTVSQQRRISYTNSDSAILYGAEVELRKSMKNIFKTGFLSDLSVNLNASYIFSEVELGGAANILQQKRALQGQSPYVVNAALGYDNKENGWNGNIIFNRFGDRIYAAGSENFATIYEIARNQLDFTIAKSFEKVTYKLGIANILDDKFQFFQDSNTDNKISDNDDPVFVHKTGALFNFSVTYKF
ncbi:TonB-dependent receptor [Flavobacterium lacus]|uniref:Outer membrane receptor protein involved in Fe transport n=1 Tax=Flavobacterium lacus TaxID=1353778 RepID=A0A328WZ31_9FLAO|nr:TonB-dependent receptor [Flavobacterium lacus]RAR50376.1 outer membrane receptor protein involved in Fe transport [Flavobacterium lacus]